MQYGFNSDKYLIYDMKLYYNNIVLTHIHIMNIQLI